MISSSEVKGWVQTKDLNEKVRLPNPQNGKTGMGKKTIALFGTNIPK
ncbi:hypothetical protein [Asticcacaulis sp. MM231]